jgi:hypothetical protein
LKKKNMGWVMVYKFFNISCAMGIFMASLTSGCQSTSPRRSPVVKAATPVAQADAPIEAQTKHYTALHIQQGKVSCFDAQTRNNAGELLTCEPSAVIYNNGSLLIASDKKTEGELLSPVFKVQLKEGVPQSSPSYVQESLFKETRKIEDLSQGPEGQWSFATSAFDRFRDDKASWDRFNTLLYWPQGQLQDVRIANPSEREGVVSSLGIRNSLQEAMQGNKDEAASVPYFKIEGLAALPGNRLIFGVRERGQSFKDFTYTVTLIEATYIINKGVLTVNPAMREIYRFQPGGSGELPVETGLSSLFYDPLKQRLFILTSFETADRPDALGAFLWVLSLKELDERQKPHLFLDAATTKPLFFPHKGEAISMIDAQRMVVLHDDDRVTRTEEISATQPGSKSRELHEGVWSLIEIR